MIAQRPAPPAAHLYTVDIQTRSWPRRAQTRRRLRRPVRGSLFCHQRGPRHSGRRPGTFSRVAKFNRCQAHFLLSIGPDARRLAAGPIDLVRAAGSSSGADLVRRHRFAGRICGAWRWTSKLPCPRSSISHCGRRQLALARPGPASWHSVSRSAGHSVGRSVGRPVSRSAGRLPECVTPILSGGTLCAPRLASPSRPSFTIYHSGSARRWRGLAALCKQLAADCCLSVCRAGARGRSGRPLAGHRSAAAR